MSKLPIRSFILSCALALAGCSFLNSPSEADLKRCVAASVGGSMGVPLSAYVEALESRGNVVSWASRSSDGIVLRTSRVEPLTGVTGETATEFGFVDRDSSNQPCGPGMAIARRMSVNGEVLTDFNVINLVSNFASMARQFVKAKAPPIEAQPAAAVEVPAENEMALDEEAEGDAAHYAGINKRLMPMLIQVSSDDQTLCCIRVEQLWSRLKQANPNAEVYVREGDNAGVVIDVETGNYGRDFQRESWILNFVDGNIVLRVVEIQQNGKTVVHYRHPANGKVPDTFMRSMFANELRTAS